jgi:hypothetical protein
MDIGEVPLGMRRGVSSGRVMPAQPRHIEPRTHCREQVRSDLPMRRSSKGSSGRVVPRVPSSLLTTSIDQGSSGRAVSLVPSWLLETFIDQGCDGRALPLEASSANVTGRALPLEASSANVTGSVRIRTTRWRVMTDQAKERTDTRLSVPAFAVLANAHGRMRTGRARLATTSRRHHCRPTAILRMAERPWSSTARTT